MEISTKSEFLSRVEIGNDQFRLLVEASPFGILIASSDEKIVLVNRFAEDLFGYRGGELSGLTIADVIEGGLPMPPAKLYIVGKVDTATIHSEGVARRSDGGTVPLEMAFSPLPCGGRIYVIATITDVTEKKENESQLAFLADVMERLYEAVIFLDDTGRVCFWNPGASSMFDVAEEEVMGRRVDQFITLDRDRCFAGDLIPRVEKSGRFEQTVTYQISSKESKRLRLKGAPVTWGDLRGSVWLANDITREARLEAEIVNVAENEQRRIGQDIHDDLCSQIAAIGCLVEVLEKDASLSNGNEARSLAKIAAMICEAGETARRIAAGLAPSKMMGACFTTAIRSLVETRQAGSPIRFSLNFENESLLDELDDETAIHLYRIIQEAMNNACKHSHASQINLDLSTDDSAVWLVVFDNGEGFMPDLRDSGMGLLTMRRRAEMMGGELQISSSPDEGTRIKCVVPLQERG